jgi:hypothetical protein
MDLAEGKIGEIQKSRAPKMMAVNPTMRAIPVQSVAR